MAGPPERRAPFGNPRLFPSIPEEHAAAIGYVALRWSEVETSVLDILRGLLDLRWAASQALTAEMPILLAVKIVASLIQLTGNTAWGRQWRAIEIDFDRLRPLRNDAVHATWIKSNDGPLSTRKGSKGKLRIRYELVSAETLNSLSNEIVSFDEKIQKFASTLVIGQRGPFQALPPESAATLLRERRPPGADFSQIPPDIKEQRILEVLGRTQPPTPPVPTPKRPRARKLSSAQKRGRRLKGDPTF